MIAYLSGVENSSINGRRSRSERKSKRQETRSKVKEKFEALTTKVKEKNKQIIEKNKALAKKIGAGVKRYARINKSVQERMFLKALEKNLLGLAVRLKAEYKIHPDQTKVFLSKFSSWDKIKNAINKGDIKNTMQRISGEGDAEGMSNEQYAEMTKQSVGIIQQIINWFKERKKSKEGDQAVVDAMANSVDADSSITKYDEKGNPLPAEPNDTGGGDTGAGDDETPFYKKPLIMIPLVAGVGYVAYKMLK